MNIAFYLAAAVAVLATLMALTRVNAVHALLYLVVSFLALSLIFFLLGAPFIAALEIIIYAGAIVVLFIFVIMLLNLGPSAMEQESRWLRAGIWPGPVVLALVLLAEVVYVISFAEAGSTGAREVTPQDTGAALFGPYVIGVELASLLLLAGLVAAFHLGRTRSSSDGWRAQ